MEVIGIVSKRLEVAICGRANACNGRTGLSIVVPVAQPVVAPTRSLLQVVGFHENRQLQIAKFHENRQLQEAEFHENRQLQMGEFHDNRQLQMAEFHENRQLQMAEFHENRQLRRDPA